MTRNDRIRRLQILREAEGYLDLALLFADHWELPPDVRNPLAQRALDVMDRLDPRDFAGGEALYLRGQALRTLERYEEAIDPLRQATSADPENIHVWLALGWCYKRTDRLDLAIEALEEALAADPTQAIIYYNLSCYWSLGGNARLALDYLAEALAMDPDYRDLIPGEEDFAPLRRHPEFQAMTSVVV